MLETRDALPVKVIAGVLWNDDACLATARRLLGESWGGVDDVTPSMAFSFTDYYQDEMGACIQRHGPQQKQYER